MATRKKNISIIIINWNNKKLTEQCYNSIPSQFRGYTLTFYIVDNNSSDNSTDYFKKKHMKATIVELKDNLGWAGGNNVAIRLAFFNGADSILLLNNDVIVTKNLIKRLLSVLYSDKNIGIVGPLSFFADNTQIIADAGGRIKKNRFFGINDASGSFYSKKYNLIHEVDFISGACMMIKAEVFKTIGLFNEKYFLYYEDVDFCLRAKQKGYLSFINQKAFIYHRVSATVGKNSNIHHYYTTRNHLLLLEYYAPFLVKVKEYIRLPKTIWEFAHTKDATAKKYSLLGIYDYILHRFGPRILPAAPKVI